MPRYDPAHHPELSAPARALSTLALDAKADRAEALLGIAHTTATGADAERLALAVALQVNRLVRMDEQGDVVSESKGDQSVTYARPASGRADPLDPEAVRIVASVLRAPEPPRASVSTPNVFVW